MPIVDVQSWLGINVDRWVLLQSCEQAYKRASRCHAFEKEWVECAHGIGQTRAEKECKLEWEDLQECINRSKQLQRLYKISQQREKMIKEGTYTPPDWQTGKAKESP